MTAFLPQGRPVKLTYAVGDPCWIAMGDSLARGRVVAIVTPPLYPYELYVIALDDMEQFTHPECRDATQMSDHPDLAPPMARVLKETPVAAVDVMAAIKKNFN